MYEIVSPGYAIPLKSAFCLFDCLCFSNIFFTIILWIITEKPLNKPYSATMVQSVERLL